MQQMLFVSIAVVLLGPFLLVGASAGMYSANSPVIQVNAKNYNRLISQSNHTSIVEFYAPWCGHCQNLKPTYEKVARRLSGLAKVAAVNCDDDGNKPLCASMGIQGFPTLKTIVPASSPKKTRGKGKEKKPSVQDYLGARNVKQMVDAVVERIPNHVTRVTDQTLNDFLEGESYKTPKAILFTNKGTTSALLRALAIDYLGSVEVAQIRNKEVAAVKEFGVKEFPNFVVLLTNRKDTVFYKGEFNKRDMSQFLSQIATPNPDATSLSGRKDTKEGSKSHKSKTKTKNKGTKHSSHTSASTSSSATPSADMKESKPSTGGDEAAFDFDPKAFENPMIPFLTDAKDLRQKCLSSKSGLCILAIVSELSDRMTHGIEKLDVDELLKDPSLHALMSLAQIRNKHGSHDAKIFPFYAVSTRLDDATLLRSKLSLDTNHFVNVIAINAKRGWWGPYDPSLSPSSDPNNAFNTFSLEAWIDKIRMGEGDRKELPTGIVGNVWKDPNEETGQKPIDDVMRDTEVDGEETQQNMKDKEPPRHEEL